ncbi:predicted protein [Haematococcus lacustris]|uniref:Uncharacterized protein n=1 Tax=Haematococcus lacustris TaxID=44745 RepID=A0A699YT70_HAELA|nr:predicted protein [Haematococcus lacustris]
MGVPDSQCLGPQHGTSKVCDTMYLQRTPRIDALLHELCSCTTTSEELRVQASELPAGSAVPWALIKQAAAALQWVVDPYLPYAPSAGPLQPIIVTIVCRQHNPEASHQLHAICRGSAIVGPPTVPRAPNPALSARREQLQFKLESMQYGQMVADVTQQERAAEDMRSMLPTAQSQLTFGAHVLVTMGTFSVLGYIGGKQLLHADELWAGLLAALGLTLGLLLETLLLIVRCNMPQRLEDRYPQLFDPKVYNKRPKTRDSAGLVFGHGETRMGIVKQQTCVTVRERAPCYKLSEVRALISLRVFSPPA